MGWPRPSLGGLLATLVGLALLLPRSGAALQPALPPQLPSAAVLARWERVTGAVTNDAGETFDYELFVDPARVGLYTISHYRLSHPATPGSHLRRETEKVVWNEHPGERQPLRLFERVGGEWRAVAPATPAYDREMRVVIGLYSLHRQALAQRDGGTP